MKPWQYVVSLLLAFLCLGVSVAIVIVASIRQDVQAEVNARQMQLNSGILGSQGQQIRMSILQDMAAAAGQNPRMKKLLARHGYSVDGQAGATNAPAARKGGEL